MCIRDRLITETGMRSEMGKLAGMIADAPEGETPLQRQLDTLGKKLAAIAGGVVTIIFVVDFLRGQAWTCLLYTSLGRFEGQDFSDCRSCDPCLDLAILLGDIALAGAALSDRRAMRHFSHVSDVSHYTLAS